MMVRRQSIDWNEMMIVINRNDLSFIHSTAYYSFPQSSFVSIELTDRQTDGRTIGGDVLLKKFNDTTAIDSKTFSQINVICPNVSTTASVYKVC